MFTMRSPHVNGAIALRVYCARVAREKKRAYRDDTHWGRPGTRLRRSGARILILGLAPAAHGANRTGRVFTGDGVGGSGDFLMTALAANGLANHPTSRHRDDGLTLRDACIAAAVRCAPPDNKPTPEEIARCLDHLEAEVACLPRVRVVVALGKIAFGARRRRPGPARGRGRSLGARGGPVLGAGAGGPRLAPPTPPQDPHPRPPPPAAALRRRAARPLSPAARAARRPTNGGTRAGGRAADGGLAPLGPAQPRAAGHPRAALCGVVGYTQAYQLIRAAAFDHPGGDLAVRILDVDVEPGVGIHHVPLDQRALQLERLVDVELGGKRVVRAAPRCQQRDRRQRRNSRSSAHVPSSSPSSRGSAAFFSSARAPPGCSATP